MIYGKNPITLEKIEIYTWLNESPDNILLIVPKNNKISFSASPKSRSNSNKSKTASRKTDDHIFCFKKSFLEAPDLKHLYLKCTIENNQLMHKDTYASKQQFYNIGYYINKPLLIDKKDLNSSINATKNTSKSVNNIFRLDVANTHGTGSAEYIQKETLMLASIGLVKPPVVKISAKMATEDKERIQKENKEISKQHKKNLPHNKEVYFDSILSKALTAYSFQWDAAINTYLRYGENYFATDIFKLYYKRYGTTLELAKQAVKDKVEDLDRAFLEAAPRNENSKNIYYRGMKTSFAGLDHIGDKITVQNFMSITSSFGVAMKFSGITTYDKCCLYKITVDRGVPHIDMVTTTKFKHEKEILLPRNLIFELVDIEQINWPSYNPIYRIPIAVIRVSLKSNDQFSVSTGCKNFFLCNIQPFVPSYMQQEIKNQAKTEPQIKIAKDENNKPLNIDKEMSSEALNQSIPLTGKKCPKGYKINKMTNMCDFFDKNIANANAKPKPKAKTSKVKQPLQNTKGMPRCKKGTRRSKITGNCEPV